jgi:hypothetical protein
MIALRQSPTLVFLAALLATPAGTQQVPVITHSHPDRVSERGFSNLVGVKELRDGQVIIVDGLEKLVLLLDPGLANGRPIGRIGSGPQEYQAPSRLFSLVGDSSAVRDQRNRRLLVLGPDGEPTGVLPYLSVAGAGLLVASDREGRLYSSWRGTVLRWSPPSPVLDTVASFPTPNARPAGYVYDPKYENPFPPLPQWAVAPSGTIAVVHPDPYRVEMFGADGIGREGPVIPIDPVEVTEEHKEQWRERMTRPGFGLLFEPTSWPRHLPPFLRDAAIYTPDGRLWIQRTTPWGDPPTFDVFDPAGRLVERVKLPPGRRLIGFGKGTAYSVVRDDLDLEYIELYILSTRR